MLNPLATVPYIIQTNDTFYKISRSYSVALDDLVEANPEVDPDALEPGQVIYIPLTAPFLSCSSISEVYVIQPGDTMYKLAQKYKLKLSTLVKSNPHINPELLLPGQKICIPKPFNTYRNEQYRVEFQYPVRWAKINGVFYEGLDGFFKLSGLSSSQPLTEICKSEAYHKLKPYGSHPSILDIKAAGTAACLIIPSSDQPMEMNGQSALILPYPAPVTINQKEYNHLILWADLLHIRDIIETLSLLI